MGCGAHKVDQTLPTSTSTSIWQGQKLNLDTTERLDNFPHDELKSAAQKVDSQQGRNKSELASISVKLINSNATYKTSIVNVTPCSQRSGKEKLQTESRTAAGTGETANVPETKFPRDPATLTAVYKPIPEFDRTRLEAIVGGAPDRQTASLVELCAYFREKTEKLSDEEKAWIIFRWLSVNISYDVETFLSGIYGDVEPEDVFHSGIGICSGYSCLYKHIADRIGLISECIKGDAKGMGYSADVPFKNTNHEWNAVKVRGCWYLLDSTWGSGHVEGCLYIKEFREYYFCTHPCRMIRSHRPDEEVWQLLETPVSKAEFESYLKYEALFYEAGLVSVAPDLAVVSSADPHGTFRVNFAPGSRVALLANLLDEKDNKIEGATFVQRFSDHFEIDVLYSRPGKYKVDFYGQIPRMGTEYSSIFSYVIDCNGESKDMLSYPTQYPTYSQIESVLYLPKTGPLKRGSTVTFKIGTTKVEALVVVVGGKWTPLRKEAPGLFSGDVVISAEDVCVYYKEKGRAELAGILSYTTIA